MQLAIGKRSLLIFFELFLVLLIVWVQATSRPDIALVRQQIENVAYDLMLRAKISGEKPAKGPVVIVDIDEKSLRAEGRWPWPRNKLADLVTQLFAAKVAVVAFDMTFSKADQNIADTLLQHLQGLPAQNPVVISTVKNLVPDFDYDKQFADSLHKGDVILGVVFHHDLASPPLGKLFAPVFSLQALGKKNLVIPTMASYWANIDMLQDAVKQAGFLTTIPDDDGILRRSPLLIQYNDAIYPSLALAAAKTYLLVDKLNLKTVKVGDIDVVEGVLLGSTEVPTDALGQVLIPYIGPGKTFPYISATDVLNGKADPKLLENALVFVGTSALGLADLHAAPIQSQFPGIEIQASIAAGLLSGVFPYKPDWANGAEVALTVFVGIVATILFPFLGSIGLFVTSMTLIGVLVGIVIWFWHAYGLVLSVLMPNLLIIMLAIVNLGHGYLFEYRRRKQLKNMFSQYIPPARVELISEGVSQFGLEGESRELTVLFADVRNFTGISEKLAAAEVRELLNRFFTPMTEIIFARNGTIDKYVGDMLMAFWGAPVADPDHAKHALEAALDMMVTTDKLKSEFSHIHLPPIEIGIGLNTGVMNVGDMGSKFRLAYTVLGDAVNLGSRIESLTKYYGVRIAVGETTRQGQQDFVFRKLDRVKVKGKEQVVELYELVCPIKQLTVELKHELDHHEQALNYYFTQQWNKAYMIFALLLKQNPDRKLYEVYLERINYLQKQQLSKEWNGVYEWQVK